MSDIDPNLDGSGERPGIPLDPLRLWLILKRHWQVVLVLTVVGAFIGAAIAKKVVGQTFQATAVLKWSANRQDVDPVERQTTIEALTLPSLLEAVRDRMQLEMPSEDLRKFLTVASNQQTNFIQVTSSWGDAEGAAKLVNTLVDAFLVEQERLAKSSSTAEVERLRLALKAAEENARKASEAYENFRAESGISNITQEQELAIERAAKLSAEADEARTKAAAAHAELERLRAAGVTEETGSSRDSAGLTASLRTEYQRRLAEARRSLDAARVQYTPGHPNILRLDAEVKQLESRLKAAPSQSPAARLAAARKQETEAAARQKEAEQYAAQVQERLGKLSAAEGRAAVLLGEVEVTSEALSDSRAALNEARITAQKVQAPFRWVEKADPPEFATESKRRKVAVGVPIAVLVLSVVGVLIWGLRKLEVLTPAEAAFWANLPVVGATTWPNDRDMLASLMHDLEDFAPHAEGVTLIIGLSTEEAPFARKISQWESERSAQETSLDRRLTAGSDVDTSFRLALRTGEPSTVELNEGPSMQILTLTGPVPAQALRRAARLADRVLVVSLSGRHNMLSYTQVRSRLGRDTGIGLLLIGLQKDFAMVRDRVGPIEQFWAASRARELGTNA